jgi:P27 family predicted phage terminase small subunit
MKAPRTLSTEASKWWKKLTEDYDIVDEAGFLLLQTGLEAFDRMRGAQDVIRREGLQVADRFGQMKAHPLLTVERDSRAQMLMALKALNLDLEPLNAAPGRPPGR